MRNKIKQLLKKEDGFTLVELLGVIVILGLILAIAIPSIGGIMSKATDDTNKAQEALIIDAARLYNIENVIPAEGVSVNTLIEQDYLESNAKFDAKLKASTVKVTIKDKIKTFEVVPGS